MQKQSDDRLLTVLTDMRNWIRAAAHRPVQAMLKEALPDAKSRAAYQMFDGTASVDQVRIACKMSPNAVVALATRCVAMGLMEVKADKKRARLFDLNDFGLIADETKAGHKE
ncbi:MAG: hypothetical protein NTW87_04950 [Planctomycetota bacterium]|nr:hypothetical protein [Planctomycetota bacterium]